MTENNLALQLRDSAKEQLAQIKTIESGLEYLKKVKTIETWVKAEKKDAELQNIIAEQKIRTQRVLGELLKEQNRNKGETDKKIMLHDETLSKPKLSDIGVSQIQSHRWQTIANIPEKDFEEEIIRKKEDVNKAVAELTTAGMLRLAKKLEPKKVIVLPEGKYNVLLADPPWQYSNMGLSGSAENHYKTMSTEEICNMKIAEKTYENAVLFLWVTVPFLKEGFKVCESWGFDYKTSFIWIKDKQTYGKLGFYAYVQHEHVFISIKGSFLPSSDSLQSSLIYYPKSKHSKKPEILYEIIEKMYPNGKYLELFARNKRPNWISWGNELEANKDI